MSPIAKEAAKKIFREAVVSHKTRADEMSVYIYEQDIAASIIQDAIESAITAERERHNALCSSIPVSEVEALSRERMYRVGGSAEVVMWRDVRALIERHRS